MRHILLPPLLHLASFAQLALPASALSDYDTLRVVHDFIDSYLYPNNIEEAHKINSTIFAEDVKGTVDITTNFYGRELSTEYIYGLFVNLANSTVDNGGISLAGSPVAYNVTRLLVQNGVAAASVTIDLEYKYLDGLRVPVILDSVLTVNSKRQISQYDIVFRRWAWAMDTLYPLLVPPMAKSLGIALDGTISNDAIYHLYMTRSICDVARTECTGDYQQYANDEECRAFLNRTELGKPYRLGEDTIFCRSLHMPMVSWRPETHCPHIGPSGGDMCISRDYFEVTREQIFDDFLAIIPYTEENAYKTDPISINQDSSLDPLLEIVLTQTASWDPSWYSIGTLAYWSILWLAAKSISLWMTRKSAVFVMLPQEHRKNVVIYIVNIVVTTVALVLQTLASPVFGDSYHLWALNALRSAGVLISGLYLFELVYREHMRLPLILHHFFTIFAISLTVAMMEQTKDPSFVASAVIWLWQATTEQLSFIGLLGYRLEWNTRVVRRILKIASVQTFIVKATSAVLVIVFWGIHQRRTYHFYDYLWTATVWILGVGLFITQIWGSYVTWMIAARLGRPNKLAQPESDMQEVTPCASRPAAAMQNTQSTASEIPLLRRTPGPGSSGSESELGVSSLRDSYFSGAVAPLSLPGSPRALSRSSSPSSQDNVPSPQPANKGKESGLDSTQCLSPVPEVDTPVASSDGHSGLTWLAKVVATDETGHIDTPASKEKFYSIKTGTSSGNLTAREGR